MFGGTIMTKKLTMYALGFIVCGPAAFAITFTGDVAADFTSPDVQVVADGHNDVGLPANAPLGTISGWDLNNASFELDRTAGLLHVGLDFRTIGGDADGDGTDGITSMWLAANGGFDLPALALTESICIAYDFDQDGSYDVISGVGALDGTYRVSEFTGNPILPAFGFGPLVAHDGGHAYGPDLEMTLTEVGALLDLEADDVCFSFLVFAGSYQDDGIGEDLINGEVCFEHGDVSAVEPQSSNLLGAFPNPFNPTTTLAVELAETGTVELAIYNVNGQLVQTLFNGLLDAGSHQLTFNAAGLPSGLYLVKLGTAQGVEVTRLVLTK
jgi:hypothetical protein